MYGCTKCGNLKFVPFRCHSRFCTTCGNMYSIDRTTSMSFKLINTTHRHCVFTIPEELRCFFLRDRSLLNCLFSAVRSVVLSLFSKINKSENFVPGFICVLHTFGRSLQWNPHIHCLVTEGASGNFSPWRSIKHFNYYYLRNSFRTALLNEMETHIGSSFRRVKPLFIAITLMASTFMLNLTSVTLDKSLNTLAVILADLLSPPSVSINMMGISSPFITIVMATINTLLRLFLF